MLWKWSKYVTYDDKQYFLNRYVCMSLADNKTK